MGEGHYLAGDIIHVPSVGNGRYYNVGGSNEVLIRNVQIFYGLAFQKVAKGLAANTSQPLWGGIGAAPAPTLVQGFQRGFFFGMTYNINGFIQSLFSGGASKSQ